MNDLRRWMRLVEDTDKRLGYRIVSHSEEGYKTLYGREIFVPRVNAIYTFKGNGLYLGTSKKFVLDYYSGGTDDSDALLTYEYAPEDLISGDPSQSDGEITVRRAKLISVEHIEDQWK